MCGWDSWPDFRGEQPENSVISKLFLGSASGPVIGIGGLGFRKFRGLGFRAV